MRDNCTSFALLDFGDAFVANDPGYGDVPYLKVEPVRTGRRFNAVSLRGKFARFSDSVPVSRREVVVFERRR